MIDILTIILYDYSIDIIEARMTRVRFPDVPGRGRERKGDSAEADESMPAFFAGLRDNIPRTVVPSRDGALL